MLFTYDNKTAHQFSMKSISYLLLSRKNYQGKIGTYLHKFNRRYLVIYQTIQTFIIWVQQEL